MAHPNLIIAPVAVAICQRSFVACVVLKRQRSCSPRFAVLTGLSFAFMLLSILHSTANMTMTELADRVGVTIANMSILKSDKAKAVRFSTLSAICAELGCQPGDLLRYSPVVAEQQADA